MAKEKEQEQEQQAATGTAAPESPVILRAKSREELDTQFQELKAKHDGHTLTAGAVGHNPDTGDFSLRVDITNS